MPSASRGRSSHPARRRRWDGRCRWLYPPRQHLRRPRSMTLPHADRRGGPGDIAGQPPLDIRQRNRQAHDPQRQPQRLSHVLRLAGGCGQSRQARTTGSRPAGNSRLPRPGSAGGNPNSAARSSGTSTASSGSPGRAAHIVRPAARAGRRSPRPPSSCPTRRPR